MATETKPPTSVLASTEIGSGTIADIDEDPDSPDANWMVATGNNVDTDVRVDFDTPTDTLTVGADLQEFKSHVRQFDEGQSGTPQVRMELWEAGVLVRAGSDENVTTGGHTLSFTWNANELSAGSGADVECKIIGTKSGGAPGARNAVDYGAVEWNVDYTVGGASRRIVLSS